MFDKRFDSHAEKQEYIDARTDEFRRGVITSEVYRASLFTCGYRGRELDSEVKLQEMMKL